MDHHASFLPEPGFDLRDGHFGRPFEKKREPETGDNQKHHHLHNGHSQLSQFHGFYNAVDPNRHDFLNSQILGLVGLLAFRYQHRNLIQPLF